jgi:hypothetical protein
MSAPTGPRARLRPTVARPIGRTHAVRAVLTKRKWQWVEPWQPQPFHHLDMNLFFEAMKTGLRRGVQA